jgi:DNA-binding IclR family transcriptional regulator
MHVLFAQSLLASNLLRRAATPLQSLGNQGLQVALGVLWRDHVCYLYHARPGTQLIDAIGGRNVYPATRSSIGLVLLASIDEAEVRRTYAKTDIPGFSSITALLSELRRVRKLGYAEVVTTPRPRDATLAVPLGDHPEAAIAFAGQSPASRRPELLTLLHRAATQIVSASSSLAHPPPVTTKGRT